MHIFLFLSRTFAVTSPKTGEPGDRFTATISGDVFTNVNQCSLGADIEVKNLNIIGDGTVAVKLTIADGAKKGLRDVKLTSPTGTGVLKNGFEVL